MGNKSSSSDTTDSTNIREKQASPNHELLRRVYETLTSKQHEGQKSQKDSFMDYFSKPGLEIGEALWRFMLQGSTELDLSHFVANGDQILHLLNSSQQHEFYAQLFIENADKLQKHNAAHLLQAACSMALTSTELSWDADMASVTDALLLGLMEGGEDGAITAGHFTSWCGRHCPHVLDAIHIWLTAALRGQHSKQQVTDGGATSHPPNVLAVVEGRCMLTLPIMWALTSALTNTYTPLDVGSSASSLHTSQANKLAGVVSSGGWSLLYDSNNHGLSLNRFQHHVFSYKGPTLTLVKFEGHLYCAAADKEWRESTQRWGDLDCKLIQVFPKFKVMQAGADIMYLNIQSRNVPKGFQFGRDPKTLVLQIDEGMSKVKHYGIELPLHKVEVWGCGGAGIQNAQQQQKQWEQKQTQKEQQRKLKLEDWKDNPDRQLLEFGGVQTEHAER